MDYKAAYERQKKAREEAEEILENRSRELYEANQSLITAYEKLKHQKAQILHQEKLASIGQLSAGVAHEINNPTGYVKSNLSTLQEYFKSLSDAWEDIEKTKLDTQVLGTIKKKYDLEYILEDLNDLLSDSIGGLSHIENIVNSLKNFARPDSQDHQMFCINECLKNTVKLVSNEIKYKANILFDLKEVPQIQGQQGSLSQVFLNMIMNASQAMDSFGDIHLRSYKNAEEIIIEIEDTGTGVSPEAIQKIFDPFYTTKDVGVGTGLGLSVSHGIVKKHHGRIHVDSQMGIGTKFTVHLPIVQP